MYVFLGSWWLNFYQHITVQRWQMASPKLKGTTDVWPHSVTEGNRQTKRQNCVPTFINCEFSPKNLEFLIFSKDGIWPHCTLPQWHSASAELLWTLQVGHILSVFRYPHWSLLSPQPSPSIEHQVPFLPMYVLWIFLCSLFILCQCNLNHSFRPEINQASLIYY